MIVPDMGTAVASGTDQPVGLASALFTPVQRVLGFLFGQPERRFQGAELIRTVKDAIGNMPRADTLSEAKRNGRGIHPRRPSLEVVRPFSKGRFGHPVEDRTISGREAATLQTFPSDYRLDVPYMEHLCNVIGNALPCDFAEAVSRVAGMGIITDKRTSNQYSIRLGEGN